MSSPSGPEPAPSGSADILPATAGVPLADLPLVADHQKTVVSSGTDRAGSSPSAMNADEANSVDLSLTLFSSNDSSTIPGPVRLEQFEVRHRIGSGGMGRVFLAEDMTLRRPVALKVLNPGAVNDSSLLARFQNEARSAALLRHDNVAQVYYTGESQGIHFIASEYIAGRTIRELIEEHETLPVDLVVNYAIQAALALNHMHGVGVIHRDIKPSNIIVSDQGRVKIVDLGLARRDSEETTHDITVAGSILGTFDYMAPEQARESSEADIRSDIYSLGCTLYHMLTGQPPYPEGNAVQKMLDHQGKQAPDPAHINDRVPGEIADIVLTMMKTNPEDRYQTPAELLSELIEVATEMGLQAIPADGIVWQHVKQPVVRQLSAELFLLAAVAVFCITAVTLHVMSGESRSSTPVPFDPATLSPSTPPDSPERPDGMSTNVDSETSDESAAGTSDTVPLPPTRSPFIVHKRDGKQKEFETLNDALSSLIVEGAEVESAEIELTFDGPLPRSAIQLPRLDHQTVHLYASKGAHPVLEFRGNADDSAPTSMFTLINSNFTLEGIALRLVPDTETTDSVWSIFDCSGSTHLSLSNCSIDVAEGTTAEVCRLKESTSDRDTRHVTDVELSDVIVRGAADMFHLESQTSGQIRMENCGIGIDGHLVNNTGSASGATSDGPGRLDVDLEHVTCVLGAPLIRIFEDGFQATSQMVSQIQVTSRACIFCSTVKNGKLIESLGTGMLYELPERLNWNGDTNLYAGFSVFWILSIPDSEQDPLIYTLDAWKSYWATRPQESDAREINAVEFAGWPDAVWRTASADAEDSSALNQLEPDWLQIDRFGGPKELPVYVDGEIPGVKVRRLPEFPKLMESAVSGPGI